MGIKFKFDETLLKKLFSLLYGIKKDFGIEIFPVSQNFSSSATPLEGGEIQRPSPINLTLLPFNKFSLSNTEYKSNSSDVTIDAIRTVVFRLNLF